jgi:hypothetical protein
VLDQTERRCTEAAELLMQDVALTHSKPKALEAFGIAPTGVECVAFEQECT